MSGKWRVMSDEIAAGGLESHFSDLVECFLQAVEFFLG
jgi:hypothetical protein